MDRRYYGAKVLLVILMLIVTGIGMALPPPSYKSTMAHLHYGAVARVEVAVLRTSAKISHVVLDVLHHLR